MGPQSTSYLNLFVKKLHHRDHNPVISVPAATPRKERALDGMGADTSVCKKEKTKETNHERSISKIIPTRTSPR